MAVGGNLILGFYLKALNMALIYKCLRQNEQDTSVYILE